MSLRSIQPLLTTVIFSLIIGSSGSFQRNRKKFNYKTIAYQIKLEDQIKDIVFFRPNDSKRLVTFVCNLSCILLFFSES